MKKIFLLGILSLVLFACSNKLANREIKVKLNYTSEYCEGAAPSEEIINSLQKPKPYTGNVFLHKEADRGDDGVELAFLNGTSKIAGLSSGTYYIFKSKKITNIDSFYKHTPIETPMIDPNCLIEWGDIVLTSFTIEKNTKAITRTIHVACNPCEPPRP
ncbi:MAG: hypothetical protein HKP14_02050 [Bacteroidia bacterium]|nr:hypothetical protein [Bacteroidia bacterium]